MKRLTKIFVVVLAIFMLMSFTACENNGATSNSGSNVAVRYGDHTLTESEYMYIASYVKNAVVSSQQTYLYQMTGTVYDEADILAMPVSGETTVADYIKDYTIELAQQMLIFEKICADSGIKITNQEDLDTISGYIADIEYNYGGEDLFEVALSRLGFARSGIERFEEFNFLYKLLYDYRYGDSGIAKVSVETVNKYFTENYIHFDGALYAYTNIDDGTDIDFGFSDDEIKVYFESNYVKVRHILYKTVDSSNQSLSDDAKAEKKAKADTALADIQSGVKTFEDYLEETEDSGYEYTFTYGQMVDAFETASFDMEIDEVRLVESEYGYHIIQKLAITDSDLFGTTDDNGETVGSITDDVIFQMNADKIRSEALDTLGSLKNGELETYPENSDDKLYYSVMDASFLDKNDSTNATFIEIVSNLELGVYSEKEFESQATYLLRNLEFTAEDITSDIYSTIEEELAADSFAEYIQSFYDSVEINDELITKFDPLTIPLLEDEFYVE